MMSQYYDITKSFSFQVSAQTADGEDVEDPSDIVIEVEDINDNPPVFQSNNQHANVKENSPAGNL